jgi:hypothetical protein
MVVHMIPHSHNDAGWLLPFEGYYKNSTEQTLTTVVDSLLSNPQYTFHWADIGFFNRWWNDQDDKRKSDVRKLVDEGRLIFINGGWVINDEALPAYKETMTQMRTGLDFIKENFGVRPSIGWQIDPFGSTAMTAAVFHKLGYSAFIENRISNDFKDILRSKDGYSFFWQAHQVDEDKTEDRIMTYILQFFYTLPGLRLDDGFIGVRKSSYVGQFWDKKVQPIVDSLNNLTHSGINEYHVMAACGDDFAFHKGKAVYKAFDELIGELTKTGKNKGYDIEVKYSNLYTYFDEMKKLDVTYGLFTGDFMPYQELWPGWSWNDFWTGYYSTRLHMKRYIRDTFNKLQSVQSLLAIKAIDSNNGSVKLKAEDEIVVDQVNNLLTEGRQRWSIMMHHDAITGTHTKITEESYYDLLKETNDYLDKAFHLLSHTLGKKANQNTINKVKSHMDDLSASNVDHYTYVNPTANTRAEVVNITMTDTRTDEDLYGVFVHHTNGTLLNVQAGFATMQDLDTESHHLQEVRKLFVPIEMPPLSHVHVYVMRCGATSSQCQNKGYKLAALSKPLKSNTARTLANSHYKVTIGGNGQLSEIDNYGSSVKSGFTERFTAFKMSGTRSGLYLFNPRSARVDVRFDETEMWYYEVPGLKSIIQAYHSDSKTKILKTYSLDQHGLDGVRSQVFIEVQAHSEERWEMFWGLRKDHLSSNNQFKAYNDDSMKLVNRPIYNTHVNFKYTNDHELNGYFTSPCIHGGMMTEETGSNVYQFSWANSNPIGCTFSDKNQVDFMVHRNIASNDNKGVNEYYDDKRATATGIMVRM